MKRLFVAVALIVSTAPVLPADLGVSVSIGQPGFINTVHSRTSRAG
ncbi:hypothetical protein [Candidatus Accumulibacter sp. ACC007]|nr:hypothetical protein [Candidatus Accumulibacter sp. ACC007]